MPNPASDAARYPAPHDTPNHATPETTSRATITPTTGPATTVQVETPTTSTANPTDDRTNQGQSQEQSTNRAGITMLVGAPRHLPATTQTLIRVRILDASGVCRGA